MFQQECLNSLTFMHLWDVGINVNITIYSSGGKPLETSLINLDLYYSGSHRQGVAGF